MDNGLEFFFLMKPASRCWLGFLLLARKGFEIYRGFRRLDLLQGSSGREEDSGFRV
jgi:hypothetical protein